MNNFLENDIKNKKESLKELPLKTKKNRITYNETIEGMELKYQKLKESILKQLIKRKNVLSVVSDKPIEQRTEKIKEKIKKLENDMFILNPNNENIEKLGLDTKFYMFKNFSEFSYDFLMQTIYDTIDDFENAEIKLTKEDFYYNLYVYEFMDKFLELRKEGTKDYTSLVPTFEKFYWHNPEMIYHIALNFRSLSFKYEIKLSKYLKSIQDNVKELYNVDDFDDCRKKLNEAYVMYNKLKQEKLIDIFNLARTGEIDIKNYLKDSKIKAEITNSLLINELKNEYEEEKFYLDLERLKFDLEQYIKYTEMKPLIDVFKEDYQEYYVDNTVPVTIKNLKSIRDQILKKEKKLRKCKDLYFAKGIFKRSLNETDRKSMNSIAVETCNELDKIYDQLTLSYYRYRIKPLLGNPVTIQDVLYVYYTYDFFKKVDIKKAYGMKLSYDELEKKCIEFDSYAIEPTHDLISSLALFKDSEIEKTIVTKHRLNNIALTIEDINGESCRETLNKVNLLLRTKTIEKSERTAEQILFVLETEKILEKEGITENTLEN